MGTRVFRLAAAALLITGMLYVSACGVIPGLGMKNQSDEVSKLLQGSKYAADWDFSLYETVAGKAEAGHAPPTVYRVLATSKKVSGYGEVMNILVYADDSMGLEGRVDANLVAALDNPVGGSAETDEALMTLIADKFPGKAVVWVVQSDGDPAETVKSEGKATYRIKLTDVSDGKATGDIDAIMESPATDGEAVLFDYEAKAWSTP